MARYAQLPFNRYQMVFDPHDFEDSEPAMVMLLADDLADIYRDLAEGFSYYHRELVEVACGKWSETYKIHWARHALSALAAIELYRLSNQE